MKKGLLKKALSVILSATMMTSVMAVGSISAGATEAEDTRNYYVPYENIETNRVYFYMPDEWYNEYGKTAGAYWWEGTDACPEWGDMYAMNPTEVEDIYSIDIPVDVYKVIFNNYFDAGSDVSDPKYASAKQTTDIHVKTEEDGDESWMYFPEKNGVPADSDLYIEGLASVDGMIFVIDEGMTSISPLYGKTPAEGEWYYYYGNGEYGFTPEKGEVVYTSEYNDVSEAIELKYNNIIYPEPTTEDGTSNCVIEPSEEPFGSSSSTVDPEPTIPESVPVVTDPEEEIVGGGGGEVINPPFEENTTKIYFDAETSGWKNFKNIYCHIWKADGTGVWPGWQTRKELCTKEDDGRYSFDTSRTGNQIKKTDGKIYCVIFSADTGAQTYNMIMSGSCLGDTAYITGISFENPEDSEKKATEAAWRNNPDCGSQRVITSTGNIIGTAFPDGESDATMMADYLIKYYTDSIKIARAPEILSQLTVTTAAVRDAAVAKLNAYVAEGGMTKAEADEILSAIDVVLDTENVPTTSNPVITDDIVPEDAKIYFDPENSGWKSINSVYCHIWRYDGTGDWPAYGSRKERCTLEADGRYSYTLSKTENEFRYSDGNIYGVIFSTDKGGMTYEMVMNGQCIGDTAYVTGSYVHSPADDEVKLVEAAWRENTNAGPRKTITPSGEVIGTAYVEGETDETLVAEYLTKFYWKVGVEDIVQDLFFELSVHKEDVLDEVKVLLDQSNQTQEYRDQVYADVEKILKGTFESNNIIHDVDGDKYTDVKDVTTLQMHLANYDIEVKESKLDVNGDGVVDVKDVTALQLYLASPKGGRLEY